VNCCRGRGEILNRHSIIDACPRCAKKAEGDFVKAKAKKSHDEKFYEGKLCRRDSAHGNLRYKNNGCCVACSKDRQKTRSNGKSPNETKYYLQSITPPKPTSPVRGNRWPFAERFEDADVSRDRAAIGRRLNFAGRLAS